jgi:peroxiredoxin
MKKSVSPSPLITVKHVYTALWRNIACMAIAFSFLSSLQAQVITDFSLKSTDGSMVSSQTYSNQKAWVVIFTGNHCVYSKKYEERLMQYAKEFTPKGVGFILINSNDPLQSEEESLNNMQNRAKEKNFPFAYLQDEKQSVAKMFNAEKNPEVFVLKGMKIIYKGAIDNNPLMPEKVTRNYLREAIEAALSSSPVKESAVPVSGCNIKWK